MYYVQVLLIIVVLKKDSNERKNHMLPVNFLAVRHGESIGNLAKRMSERGDHSLLTRLRGTHTAHWPLTEKGRGEAVLAGKLINQLSVDKKMFFERMYVSSYARAVDTAGHLDLTDPQWLIDTRITERDWGELDRMTEEERNEKFGEALMMRTVEPFFWAPPNGESFNDLILRVRDFIASVARLNLQNVLVVCHGEVMKAFRIVFHKLTPSEYGEMEFSKDPLKRIYNCQIDHYSRCSPETSTISERLEWFQVYRYSEKESIVIPWKNIPRRRHTSSDLLQIANKLSRDFADIKY